MWVMKSVISLWCLWFCQFLPRFLPVFSTVTAKIVFAMVKTQPCYSFLSFATPFIPVSIKRHSSLSRVHHIDDPPALQHTRCTHPVDSITRHWPYQQQQLSIPKLVQTVHGGRWRHACLHAGLLLSPWSKSWYMAHEISVNFAHSQCEFSVKLGLFLKPSVK